MIPLSVPNLSGNEWRYVKDCLDTGWISSAGEYVTQFENRVAEYTGAKHAIACVNGTAGLHIALQLAGVGSGDYVVVPNLTFVATLNAIKYCGASPLLIDIDANSWQMDVSLLDEFLQQKTSFEGNQRVLSADGRAIKALLPVHVLGNVGDMQHLEKIGLQYGIPIVEDACEALGSYYKGRHCGIDNTMSVLSFNGNKIISTGGGGMILTSDTELARQASHLTTQAKIAVDEYDHDQVAYNYRLVNVLAAIGLAQMEKFTEVLARNKRRDQFYREELGRFNLFDFQEVSPEVNPNCWLFTFRTAKKAELIAFLDEQGVQSRPFWRPMNSLPMYSNEQYVTHNDAAYLVYQEAISIPSSSSITDAELEQVVEAIARFFDRSVPQRSLSALEPKLTEAQPDWKVQLFELNYDDAEASAAKRVIDSRWITMGDQIKTFELKFAELLQNRVMCKAMSSCTAALHTALMALDIGVGDEVIVPALTFVADANVCRIVGATPVPADCDSMNHWNMSAATIEAKITEKTRAVIIVHYAGYSCDMDPIVDLCKRKNLFLIEDAAHAPGASYKGQPCGTFGDFGCFSFFTNKNISIGEGGMLVTASKELAEKTGFIRSQGMTSQTLDRHRGRANTYDVAIPGLNYRMDEMRAAIGLAQLEKLAPGNSARRNLSLRYRELLADCEGILIPFTVNENSEPAFHIFPVLLPDRVERTAVIKSMQADQIQTSIHYLSFREFTAYQDAEFGPTPNADVISKRVLTLPLFPTMTVTQCEQVVASLRKALGQ